MSFTGQLGSGDSQLGNILLGEFQEDGGGNTFNGYGQAQAYIQPRAYGQAQGLIKRTENGYGQAQGQIKQTYNGFGQAQATILGWVFGQAQASILQTYNVFAQSQAEILQTYRGYGQAQASIGSIGYAVGQAQADILQTYQGYSQAQARILQTYNGYGQAQGDILQVYQGYGQAQGLIVVIGRGFGQAQGDILQTYNAFAQAQAGILQIYNSCGQAQGQIKQIYQAYAQAQGTISINSRGYGQAQTTIIAAYQGYGCAQGYILNDKVYGQSQAKILRRISNPAQAQAYIKEQPVGQAQALIDSAIKNEHGQAQAFICWTDTFTRVTSFGLGSEYTWQNWNSNFGAAGDSTYHVDGTKLINDPDDFDTDSYSINDPVPTRGTFSFEFTTESALVDFPWLIVLFGADYQSGRYGLGVYSDGGTDWFLTAEWNQGGVTPDIPITLATSTTYRVKFSYDDTGNFAGKIWAISGSEPDWMITGTVPNFVSANTAWLDLAFFQDVASFDNLNFCTFEPFEIERRVYAQAQALINRSQGYGQAQGHITNTLANSAAQAYIAWESVQTPFLDTFTRTTNRGLGAPYYLWNNLDSSVDHPAATTINVNGTKVVIPAGKSDSYWLGYTFKMHNRLEFEVTINTIEPFEVNLIVSGSPERSYNFYYTGSGNYQFFVYDGTTLSSGSGFTPGTGVYKFVNIFSPVLNQTFFFKDGAFTGSTSGTGAFNRLGNTNLLIKYTAGSTTAINFDNLYLDSGTWRHGQARARIKLVGASKHAQARARIKNTYRGFAQAQASINQVWKTGQAQAFIGDQLRVGWAQAQAHIRITRRGHGQARASIKTFRWVWGQAQGQINRATNIVCAQAQAYIAIRAGIGQAQALIAGIKTGQAQAYIKRTIGFGQARAWILGQVITNPGGGTEPATPGNLVRYNGYYLPGYLQYESVPQEMTIEAHVAAFQDTVHSEYLGLKNKLVSIRMKVLSDTYLNAKSHLLDAGTILRSNRSSWTPLFVKHPDKYYLALTKNIETGQTAGTGEKNPEYTVDFECKPWLFGTITHTLTGNTTLDTNAVGRTYLQGTYSPIRMNISGTNVTVSGYTEDGEFTGFISISGVVSNLSVDTENMEVRLAGERRNDLVYNYDYKMYVGPGRTFFDLTGADEVTIEYEDRWNL